MEYFPKDAAYAASAPTLGFMMALKLSPRSSQFPNRAIAVSGFLNRPAPLTYQR